MPGRVLQGRTSAYAILQSLAVQATILLVNVSTGIVTARFLGPDGRGIFTAIILWPQLLGTLGCIGVLAATTYGIGKAPDDRGPLAGAAMAMATATTFLGCCAVLPLIPRIMNHYDPTVVLVAQVCVFSAIASSLQNVVNASLAGLRSFSFYNLCRLAPQACYLIVLIAFAAAGRLTWQTAVASILGGAWLSLLLALPFFRHVTGLTLRRARTALRSMRSYIWRCAPADLLVTFSAMADRIVLVPLVSAAELGYYVVALSLARVVVTAMPAINGVMLSRMASSDRAEAKFHHDHAFRFTLHFLVVLGLAIASCAEPLLILLYGEEFAVVAPIFRILLVDSILAGLASVTVAFFQAVDRPGYVSGVEGACFVAVVVGILFLTPSFGVEGAAIAMASTSALRLAMLMLGLRLRLSERLPRFWLTPSDIRYLGRQLMPA